MITHVKSRMKADEQLLATLTHYGTLDQGHQTEMAICRYMTDRKFNRSIFNLLRAENIFIKVETRAEGDPIRYRFTGTPSQHVVERVVDAYKKQALSLKKFNDRENSKIGDNFVRVTKNSINKIKDEKMGQIRESTLGKYKQLVEELYNKSTLDSVALNETISRLKCMKQVQGIMNRTGVMLRNKRQYKWNNQFFPSIDLAIYLLKFTNAHVQTKPFKEVFTDSVTGTKIDPSSPTTFEEPAAPTVVKTPTSKVSAASVFDESESSVVKNTPKPQEPNTEVSKDVKVNTAKVDIDMELSLELIRRGRKTEALALLKNGSL